MKGLKSCLPVLVILAFASALSAQADLKAYLDSTRIEIGDQLNLHLLLSCIPGIEISNPDLQPFEAIPELEILSTGNWDTIDVGNRLTLQKTLVLTAWDSGYYEVPAIPVSYRYRGQTDTIYSRPIPLEVATIVTDSSSITPIKPIIEEPVRLSDYWPFLAGLGGLILIGLLIYWLLRRKKPPEIPLQQVVQLPPHELAFQKLRALEAEALWEQGEIKEYHYQLTYIVREYLENRYQIPALESTTTQLLGRLKKTGFPADWQPRLRALLQTADLVKFAKAQPGPEFHPQAMREALALVSQTHFTPATNEEE